MTAAMDALGDRLALTEGARQGRAARRLVRERAAKVVGDPAALDDIELMTAEAVANAVLHGTGVVQIGVATDGRRLRVEVRDEGPARRPGHASEDGDDAPFQAGSFQPNRPAAPEAARAPAGDADSSCRHPADHGRGLIVIDSLAEEWGLEQTPTETLLWFVINA
ncbi:ATP-binding protein [Actinomadura sp. NPDC047616]|uniref:ATP-binding protein n=1 Tax=Actinomadura sp. NPDC047616 TaxID=3155914 RepID=UPI0033DBC4F6